MDKEHGDTTPLIISENSTPEIKDGVYFEKRYKNVESAYTKSQQNLIETGVKLINKDISNIELLDTDTQNKVIKKQFDLNSLEELKLLRPELFEKVEEKEDERYIKLEADLAEQKQKIYLTELKAEIANYKLENSVLVKKIDNFEEKLIEELKNISGSLPIKDRVEKSAKLLLTQLSPNIPISIKGADTPPLGGGKEEGKKKLIDQLNELREINYHNIY